MKIQPVLRALDMLRISGEVILPLVEGGKGIGASDGASAGAWAAAGGAGTFSAVMAATPGDEFQVAGKTRVERQIDMIRRSIQGGIAQARIAHETRSGRGRIHVNILWEMGGAQQILEGILDGARGLVHGVTCGAGLPFKLAEIASRYNVWYYPIVSSARAFQLLWTRAYRKMPEWLGGVVYEDPWRAGGHNGLAAREDPDQPEDPRPRVEALRTAMNAAGLSQVPIVMAGGVWSLSEWQDWIEDPRIAPVAFQFGTRPLLTRESPLPAKWKAALPFLRPGQVRLQRFSPTGFPSSAVNNAFLQSLQGRSDRQLPAREVAEPGFDVPLAIGARGRLWHFASEADRAQAEAWIAAGYGLALATPEQTLIFVTEAEARTIQADRAACLGCLSACRFSGWSEDEARIAPPTPDPRSFCISKSLRSIISGEDPEQHLMFAGSSVWRFAEDPLYAGGHVPTVAELVQAITEGR